MKTDSEVIEDGERRARFVSMFILFIVSTFNYVDRTIISILQVPIKADLNLTDAHMGALTGLSFALFYTTFSLPIARLADRMNRRNIIAISLFVWSGMTALSGLARNFAMLVGFRIGVAIGEAGSIPASQSIIADYYPAHRRATALAIWGLSLPVGLMGLRFLQQSWTIMRARAMAGRHSRRRGPMSAFPMTPPLIMR